MKAFKNRLEEMAEATVNALDYSDSKENTQIFRINFNSYVYSASG